MFPDEINPFSRADVNQPAADSPFVHFVALRSNEFEAPIASTRQLSAQPEANQPSTRPQDFLTTPLIWLLPLWGAIVWLLLLGTASEAWKLLQYRPSHTKPGQKLRVPCKNCRYYSSNFYLKCAVRPSDALTERAVDCSDFCQKDSTAEIKPLPKRDVRH